MKIIISIITFFLLITFLQAQANVSPNIQGDFSSWAKKNNIVGAALAVDNVSYFYGYSNKKSARAESPQLVPFMGGSL